MNSALARPQNLRSYGEEDCFQLAACYAEGIARNHPFVDGNKRTAFQSADLFLALNGYDLDAASSAEHADMIEKLAQGLISRDQAPNTFKPVAAKKRARAAQSRQLPVANQRPLQQARATLPSDNCLSGKMPSCHRKDQSMTIREIHANDKSQWLALWSDYLSYYKVDLDDHVTHGVWQRLMDAADPLKGFVCVNNDRVIGFTHYFFHGTTWNSTSYCYLEDLFVDQTVRSKGAGRALISAVRDAATKQGAAKLYWHTDSENETAQALYNKVAERTGFIRYDVTL